MLTSSIYSSLLYLIPIALLILVIRLIQNNYKPVKKLDYQRLPALFTNSEIAFMEALYIAVDGRGSIFGKVRIADVLEPAKGLSRSNWQTSFNKIAMKHFDFVICHNEDLSIICAIELDDKSHSRKRRIERDVFVNSACESASFPLIRFKTGRSYRTEDLQDKLSSYL
jgi:hypothetical protein